MSEEYPKVNGQFLIVYDNEKNESTIYSSAYSMEQAKEQAKYCTRQYTVDANPRIIPAEGYTTT